MQKQKVVHAPVDIDKLLKRCEELLSDYPKECKEYLKIKKQIEDLEKCELYGNIA